MEDKSSVINNVARIENAFVEKAQYNLAVREQKILLFLIANIDPRSKDFRVQTIPVKEIEEVLKKDGKKWGGLYTEMRKLTRSISRKQITFPSGIELDGQELEGYINWFSRVAPVKNKKGEVCISFSFAPELKPFLLQLKQFVKIDRSEVSDMRSFYSIRLYQLFKATYQKQKKYKTMVHKTIGVEEFRALLNLEEKYPRFTEIRRRVLNPAKDEINSLTSLHVDFDLLRNSQRAIESIKFTICHKNDIPKQLSLLSDGEKLTLDKAPPHVVREKMALFDWEEFRKEHPEVVRRKTAEARKELPSMGKDHPAFKNSVVGLCQKWFFENC